jgi:hypothetical protein
MVRKVPFKQNKAGRWINTSTGRFAKKEEYIQFAERKEKANISRSEKVKDYWVDVKKLQSLGYDLKTSRRMLSKTPKYAKKTRAKSWGDFWKIVKDQNMTKDQRKALLENEYTDDDGEIELITY